MKERQLTNKQKRFVEEYVIDCNATQAAKRAGYSQRTADKQGTQLLVKTSIKKAIDEKMASLSKSREIDAETVLNEIRSIALLDLPEFFVTKIKDLSEDDIEKISKLSGMISTKMKNKVKALEMLAKYIKLYEKDEHEIDNFELIDKEIEEAIASYQSN